MSKTLRLTCNYRKSDWLPRIHEGDLEDRYLYGMYLKADPDAIKFIEDNPHRIDDVGDWMMINYSKNPSWWNNIHHSRPRRRDDKRQITKIKTGAVDPEDAMFLNGKKPYKWYW